MKCRTCAHCAIINQLNGFCHSEPPQSYFLRLISVDGEDAITPIGQAIQLIQSYSASTYPPVNPTNRGCRLHRLSIFTWWRWKFGERRNVPSPVVQERA